MKLMLDDILPLVGKEEGSSFRLRFGEVVGIEGSTLVIAAKDAARLEHEMSQAGVSYEAGQGITIEDRVISADVTMQTIDGVRADTIPLAFIEAL